MHETILRASRLLMILGALGLVAQPVSAGESATGAMTASEPGEACASLTSDADDSMDMSVPCATCNPCTSCNKKPPFFKTMKEKWRQFDKEQLHPDHCWPEQYGRESQRRVYAPLRQQMLNGLALESMVWPHYFDGEDSDKLSAAGESRLDYLARRRPYVISTVGLQTSFDRELDIKRIQVINQFLSTHCMEQVAWNVIPTNRGTPIGLFGDETIKQVDNMIGIAGQPPRYQPQQKYEYLNGDNDD